MTADALLASNRVNKGADLAADTGHTIAIEAACADIEADYSLIAKIAPSPRGGG